MKKVIYTVVVDGYDRLLEQPRYPGWDYVCFTDGRNMPLRARLGLTGWKIIRFDGLGFDGFRFSRLPKILPHRYLKDYDYSVYIDGNAVLLDDPSNWLEQQNWPDFVVADHPFRDQVMDEFDECISQKKADPIALAAQKQEYLAAGLPADTVLMENNLLMRRHNAADVINLDETWWNEMNRVTHRDQLSLPFVSWKAGFWPTRISQPDKRSLFKTKAHFRSLMTKLKRSMAKRLSQA